MPHRLPTLRCFHIQSSLTLCDPMDSNLPVSSVHGILQAGMLEWVAIPFSRGSSRPRDWTQVSCIADSLLSEPPGKPFWIHWISRYFLSMSSSFSPWDPWGSCFLHVSCFTPRSYMGHAYCILITKCQFHRKGFPDSIVQCSHPVPHFHITFL